MAVVTGAANGLGRAIAERLAGDGARVVLGDIDAAGLERAVAGIAQVTAGCETTNFRKNCDHAAQPISAAHSGSGLPRTRSNRSPVRNGRLMITALPRARAAGSSFSSASRSPML